jgi:hypothetical protein
LAVLGHRWQRFWRLAAGPRAVRALSVCVLLAALITGCDESAGNPGAVASEGGLEALETLLGDWCVEGQVVATNGTEAAASGWARVELEAGGAAQVESLRLQRGEATVELLMVRTWDRFRGVYRFGLVRSPTASFDVLEGSRVGDRWEVNSLPFDDFVRLGARSIHTSLVLTRPDADRYQVEFFGSADAGGTWARGTRLSYTRDRTGACRPPIDAAESADGR